MKEPVYIGADHAGYRLKNHIKSFLSRKGYDVVDKGAHELDKNDDYPDFAAKVAKAVQKKGKGILICGSAEGICIAANKFKGIRAVPIRSIELAKLSRQHNDANILCLAGGDMRKGKRVGLDKRKAEKIALTWLKTAFSEEERHIRRIKKIERIQK